MKKTNLTFKKAASILTAGLMLVSFIACPSPTDPKDDPEPEPEKDTYVSEHVTTEALSIGIKFTFEKKTGDDEVYQIFIEEDNEIYMEMNYDNSAKIVELNKNGSTSFTFPFTEADKESTFKIWFNCEKGTHEDNITVKATGGKGKASKFYDKTNFDKVVLNLADSNKTKKLSLTLPSGKKTFNDFIKDKTVLTAKALNMHINRSNSETINNFITNGVIDLADDYGKKIVSEMESKNGTDIYNLYGLTKTELNKAMDGYTDYSATILLMFEIDSAISGTCSLDGIDFHTPNVYSKSFPYTAAYKDPAKDESQHITLEKDTKGIKVTANWLEEDGEWYDTVLYEKESGMGIYFCKDLNTIPTEEEPVKTYYYIFTEADKSYTFSFASNTSLGGYHTELLECTAGGGKTNLFTLNEEFKNAEAEIEEDGSYKIDSVCSIFTLDNLKNYEDIKIKLTFNSGDIYWNDAEWAGNEMISYIKEGLIDTTDYDALLKGKKIDSKSEIFTTLSKRDVWNINVNLLVKFANNDTFYSIKYMEAESAFSPN